MNNYYKILEVEPKATHDEIRTQYRLLVHAWHPDKFPNPDQKIKAELRIKEINEAYRTLSDPGKRLEYDMAMGISPKPSPPVSQPVSNSSNNTQFNNQINRCNSCGLPFETQYVEFYENIGMVFLRRTRTVKGDLCKSCIDYYFWTLTGRTMLFGWWGVISFIITPFLLINNLFRYLSKIGMNKPPLQIIPSPSPFWVFSTVTGFLAAVMLVFSFFTAASQSSNVSLVPNTPTKTNFIRATQTSRPTTRPAKTSQWTTKPIIKYKDLTCKPWYEIGDSDLDTTLCIYGTVNSYGPYSNEWNTIEFSRSSLALRMTDYNYKYSGELNIGDCVRIYGRIRDNGNHLFIAPDKDAEDSISKFLPEYCD